MATFMAAQTSQMQMLTDMFARVINSNPLQHKMVLTQVLAEPMTEKPSNNQSTSRGENQPGRSQAMRSSTTSSIKWEKDCNRYRRPDKKRRQQRRQGDFSHQRYTEHLPPIQHISRFSIQKTRKDEHIATRISRFGQHSIFKSHGGFRPGFQHFERLEFGSAKSTTISILQATTLVTSS